MPVEGVALTSGPRQVDLDKVNETEDSSSGGLAGWAIGLIVAAILLVIPGPRESQQPASLWQLEGPPPPAVGEGAVAPSWEGQLQPFARPPSVASAGLAHPTVLPPLLQCKQAKPSHSPAAPARLLLPSPPPPCLPAVYCLIKVHKRKRKEAIARREAEVAAARARAQSRVKPKSFSLSPGAHHIMVRTGGLPSAPGSLHNGYSGRMNGSTTVSSTGSKAASFWVVLGCSRLACSGWVCMQ